MSLVTRSRREIERGPFHDDRFRESDDHLETNAECQPPKPLDHNRITVLILQRAEKSASIGIERVDAPVAEIADEERIAKPTKAKRRPGDAPRGIERALRGKSL